MRVPVEDQIRALYAELDETQLAVELAEVVEAVDPVVEPNPAHRRVAIRPGWIVVAAMAVALIIAGIAPLLSPPRGGTAPASSPTLPEQGTDPDLATSMGVLSWSRLEGSPEDIPGGVMGVDSSGLYTHFEYPFVWHSEDAVTWVREEVHPDLAGYATVERQGSWAFAWKDASDAMPVILRQIGDSWEAVAMDDAGFPAAVGLTWDVFQFGGHVVGAGDVVIISGETRPRIPWEDHYGTFSWDCGEPEPCVDGPIAWWSDNDEKLHLIHPGDVMSWEEPEPLAVIEISVGGDVVSFVDTATGEVVHEVIGTADYPATAVARGLRVDGAPPSFNAHWVSRGGSPFDFQAAPWVGEIDLVASPGGGFIAYVYSRDSASSSRIRAEVWGSIDGTNWEAHGAPEFLADSRLVDHVGVHVAGSRLIAAVDDIQEHGEIWMSPDGFSWTRVENSFPHSTAIHGASFGYLAAALPQGSWMLWVSADGLTWEAIEPPPGPHEPLGVGFAGAGAVGDIIWVSVEDSEGGTRTLWIGRFE